MKNPFEVMSKLNITKTNVCQNQLKQVVWCQQILTDRNIPCNKPDIIFPDSKELLARDVSLPADKNVVSDEAKRMLKYKDLLLEVHHIWN
jgi:hypothetical protein